MPFPRPHIHGIQAQRRGYFSKAGRFSLEKAIFLLAAFGFIPRWKMGSTWIFSKSAERGERQLQSKLIFIQDPKPLSIAFKLDQIGPRFWFNLMFEILPVWMVRKKI